MKTIADYITDGWVKILRTGTWTDRRKKEHHFDESRLQRIADNYTTPLDFSVAAITATHDAKPDTPPLGKIETLKRVGQFLLAKPVNVMKDTIKVLKDIGYKFVSASLNPNDTINHLALVLNPAVSGLGEFNEAALNFSQPGEDTIDLLIEFSALEEKSREEQLQEWAHSLRPPVLIIDDYQDSNDQEINQTIDVKEEQNMFQKKKKPDDDKQQVQDAAADDSSGEENEEKVDFAAALATANSKAEEATQKANELESKLGKMEQEKRQKEVADFCNSLKPGAILPKFMPGIKTLLNLLTGEEETLDFSDGKGEKETPLEFTKSFLSALESQIPLDPLKKTKGDPGDDDEFEFADADDEDIELHRKAKAIMKEDKCTYEEALKKAERR